MRKLFLMLSLSCFFQLTFTGGSAPAEEFSLVRARPALQTTVLRGYTRARRQQHLVAEESGRCLEVNADVGDLIPAAGSYATLDTTFLDLELQANQAACERLANQMAYWQRELQRFRSLSGGQAVAEARVQEYEQQFDQARLGLAELKVKAEILQERRRRCRIMAPPGWRLIERRLEPGEWLVPGQIVGLAGDYRGLVVPFSLTMEQFRRLEQELAAGTLSLSTGGDNPVAIPARLFRVSPAFSASTRKIEIELEVSEGLEDRRGGIVLELLLTLPEAGGVVEVPAGALFERYGATWLVRDDGVEVRVIKVGVGLDGYVQIVGERLKAGELFRYIAPSLSSSVKE
ncbi:MAG TPA: efflux transporter periplasmic adaptor subunit [Proteobacteria bacterium]|nr:efflux transporter periplasmic adaptor subunit [Pseudomonadota bacterium]